MLPTSVPKALNKIFRHSWQAWLVVSALILLFTLPRFTALNQYIIVDEADRWRWAEDFVYALSQGDLAATLVGDGYPGIVPVWAESIWIFLEAGRRSLVEGQWIGEAGLYHLFHEWDRVEFLGYQRFPIVLLNMAAALAIVWTVWRLFGQRVALVSALLIALDPFYLSDSRVNRAEALITGLMTLSMLFLIFYYRRRRLRDVVASGIFGGLSLLTKIQALAIAPAIALTGLLIYLDLDRKQHKGNDEKKLFSLAPSPYSLFSILRFGLIWIAAAALIWFILWPSMWVTPLDTLSLVYNYTTRKVGPEGISLFFLGETYQDADPGLIFYPIVFFMRLTPLALFGLLGAILRFTLHVLGHSPLSQFCRTSLSSFDKKYPDDPFAARGSAILVIYVIVYALMMTFGSHKQDRYLMPIFLSVDILAAMGLVYLWVWLKNKITNYQLPITNYQFIEWSLLLSLLLIQLVTILPHHPYYYSYFNPLFGGGRVAAQTLRIGWGEGMDQVGRYLASKPNSRDLVVSTRFTHNMPDFKGELISLTPGGRWTRADYIVLYIQQVQRHLDPDPDFIDYFQARRPEKVITIGGIDYAWIYPIPFTVPADPTVSLIPEQVALLGYRWEANDEAEAAEVEEARFTDASSVASPLRLFWRNLGLRNDRQLAARLVKATTETEWVACLPDPNFSIAAQTAGRYTESVCSLPVSTLPPNTYTVEFGLTSFNGGPVEKFLFPEGWQAARINSSGQVVDTAPVERLEAILAEQLPPAAQKLDRIYAGHIRLAAYQLDPPQPKPGDTLTVSLYWQPVGEMVDPVDLVAQLADARSISLGRTGSTLYRPPLAGERETEWLPGKIITRQHRFELAPELVSPLGAQLEVSLFDGAKVALQPTTLGGAVLDKVVARLTIAPDKWPALAEVEPVEAMWEQGITLRGYKILSNQVQPGNTLSISFFWEADQPISDNYVVFVHLLDTAGQLRAQHDSLPRAGAYPTLWWQPRMIVEDTHPVLLPEDLPGGVYRWVVGLYREEDGIRLPLMNGDDNLSIETIEVR